MATKNPNEFLKDLTVDTYVGKRRVKVIVLNETDKAVVYIPLKAITRVDYNRLKEIHEKAELDLLTTLRDYKLDNGRNALVTYKNVIEVQDKVVEPKEAKAPDEPVQTNQSEKTETDEKPKRKPGRPPKAKAKE